MQVQSGRSRSCFDSSHSFITCSLSENNGLFNEESNETQEVSIMFFLYSVEVLTCMRPVISFIL